MTPEPTELPGAPGKDGTSVSNTVEPPGANCAEGGSKFIASGTTYACNGLNGSAGGGTLPSGETETGIWGIGLGGAPGTPGTANFPISFPIPLEEAPIPTLVNANEESKPGCPGRGGGTFSEGYEPTIPQADPGRLCVYVMTNSAGAAEPLEAPATFQAFKYNSENSAFFAEYGVATPTGVFLGVYCTNSCTVGGTWAVTAE